MIKNKIKVIIFDLGGVVISPKVGKIFNLILNYIGVDRNQFNNFLEKHISDLTKGKKSLSDFYSDVVTRFKLKNYKAENILNKHLELFQETIKDLDEDVLNLIKKLKENYKVICLVNAESEVVPLVRKRGVYNYFDKAYISTELGMEKPDPEIYYFVLQSLKCKPEAVVFIDDRIENVGSASKIGIKSILFQDYKQLKKDLEFFKVIVN